MNEVKYGILHFLLQTYVIFGRLTGGVTSAPAPVEIAKGNDGLEKVILRHVRGSSAEIYLYGGQVTSWKNKHGEELLFLSSKALFTPPKPIRGGIPLCFPQFSNLGPLASHGFARNRLWMIDPSPPPLSTNSPKETSVNLILKPTEEDLKIWPHRFEYRLRVTLGPSGNLMLTSRVRNTDAKPFTFTFAYHAYFSVSDIREVRVEGLEKLDYLDNLKNRTRFTEQGDAVAFESEVDRIYLTTPPKVAILDNGRSRTFTVRKDGLPDAVVWNPWEEKAKTISDLGDGEYKIMVCVEASAIEKPIALNPGQEWTGKLDLSSSHPRDPRVVLRGD
ncbi:putative glucose-6-phosphate 1-epimerase [Andrographis paniculata]|uniref:putative glucose-6-phosphate 1-epimerase n=1 Tax=Andrographis paniculata TaxID=175694 RepID=UPI0021E8B980|nr:putative glucose-6-phosphate 1-epimerase [Andrographis paniculata]